MAIFVPVDDNATGAEFYTPERDTPGNIVFNIVVNVQLPQYSHIDNHKAQCITAPWCVNYH